MIGNFPQNNLPKITAVIFAKDEEATVAAVIEEVKSYVYSVVIADGHSADNTQEIARRKGVEMLVDPGRGKGAAIRFVIDKIESDILLFMDADGSHRPEEIPQLTSPLANGMAEMVIASRILGSSEELKGNLMNLIRLQGNRLSNFVINLLWGRPKKVMITDCQNGFRAIKSDIAKQLNLEEDGFAIEQEMVIKCLKKNFSILEIPSHELKRKFGKSHIRPLASLYAYTVCFLKNLFHPD